MPYADGSSRQGWRARVGRIALEAWGNFGDKLTLEERDRESGYEWNDLPQNRMMDTRVGPEWGPTSQRCTGGVCGLCAGSELQGLPGPARANWGQLGPTGANWGQGSWVQSGSPGAACDW